MKNKKLVYILLPVAVLVWGIILYRIIKAVDVSAEQDPYKPHLKEVPGKPVAKQDTFQLILGYRDPFLPRRKAAKVEVKRSALTASAQKQRSQPHATQSVVIPVQWPAVSYQGFVENKRTKTKIAMLKIGEHDQLLDEGDVALGIKVLSVYADSIQLSFGKEVKFIKKNR